MRTILVTGAGGRLGRAVVAELIAGGCAVIATDRISRAGMASSDFRQIDLLRDGLALDLLAQCDAVVHLAALPDLSHGSPQEIVSTNVSLTMRVLQSAMEAGVRTFLNISSQCALGFPFANGLMHPDYLPIDELHPSRPEDAYGLSKLLGEEICAYAARRYDASIACLRFPAIWDPANHGEHVAAREGSPFQAAKSLWAYIDTRDAARAVRMWLEKPTQGFEIFNVAAPWAFAREPIQNLIERSFGRSARDFGAEQLNSDEALYSSRKIETRLGFCARYRWYPDHISECD